MQTLKAYALDFAKAVLAAACAAAVAWIADADLAGILGAALGTGGLTALGPRDRRRRFDRRA